VALLIIGRKNYKNVIRVNKKEEDLSLFLFAIIYQHVCRRFIHRYVLQEGALLVHFIECFIMKIKAYMDITFVQTISYSFDY